MTRMGAHSTRASRRRRRRLTLTVFVAANVVVATLLIATHDGGDDRTRRQASREDTRPHGRSVPTAEQRAHERRVAVMGLLDRRSRAIRQRDRAVFMASVDPRARSFRSAQAAYFRNLAGVPLASWRYTLDDGHVEATKGHRFDHYHAPTWGPHVVVHYTLRGVDRVPTSLDAWFTFVRRHGRWYVASDRDFEHRGVVTIRDLWDDGPVTSVRRGGALVLGHPGGPVSLEELAAETARDIPRVSDVWGRHWSRSVVVLAPDSEHELASMLCDGGDLGQIAALASVEVSCTNAYSGPLNNRIMVNPLNYVRLGPLGRRVVMTHEVMHVATRRATGGLEPTWLVEGIADYVGYLGTGVPTTVAAHELESELADGAAGLKLPTDKAYNGKNPHLPEVYERSWLACRYIAEHYGKHALIRLYRHVGAAKTGPSSVVVDRAMHDVLGVSLDRFTREWRAYVIAALR
jgi:hypothetical protein